MVLNSWLVQQGLGRHLCFQRSLTRRKSVRTNIEKSVKGVTYKHTVSKVTAYLRLSRSRGRSASSCNSAYMCPCSFASPLPDAAHSSAVAPRLFITRHCWVCESARPLKGDLRPIHARLSHSALCSLLISLRRRRSCSVLHTLLIFNVNFSLASVCNISILLVLSVVAPDQCLLLSTCGVSSLREGGHHSKISPSLL